MFSHLSSPRPSTGRVCTRKANGILNHSRNRAAVAEFDSATGAKVYLCAGCLAAMKAWRWLRKHGTTHPGHYEIRAAADFLANATGFTPPTVRETSVKQVEAVWRLMRQKERQGLVMATGKPAVFMLVRDPRACLDCRQVRGHLDGCGLMMDWPERIRKSVL